MIKIQLCPPEELENPLWFVPDVLVAVVVIVAAYMGAQWYLGTIQEQVDVVEASTASLRESTAKLKPDLVRFDSLKVDIATLNARLSALRSITTSKFVRFKPLIVFEHFQNLRPEGVWFKSLKVGVSGADKFELSGQAFDNLLVAEFLTAVRSTDTQEKDDGDMRTQVGFADLELVETRLSDAAGRGALAELAGYPHFSILGRFIERGKIQQGSGIRVGAPSGSGSAPPPVPKPAAPPAPVSQRDQDDDTTRF